MTDHLAVPEDPRTDCVIVRYETTPRVAWDAVRAMFRSQLSPGTKLALELMRALLFLLSFYMLWICLAPPKGGPAPPGLVGLSLFLMLFTLFGPWLYGVGIRLAARRRSSRTPEKERWIEWTISPDEVWVRTYSIESRVKWSAFRRVVEHARGLIFLVGPNQGLWLPASAIPSESEANFIVDCARRCVSRYRIDRPLCGPFGG
jgi:hypothetical protein